MIREISEWWGRMEAQVQRIQPPQARRIVVAIIGFTVLLLGVVMLVLPGPAFIVIPAGLAILALEFAWAKHGLAKMKELAQATKNKMSPPPRPSRHDSPDQHEDGHRMPS
jgi:uncharacterized protein (TIGR02611 family)